MAAEEERTRALTVNWAEERRPWRRGAPRAPLGYCLVVSGE